MSAVRRDLVEEMHDEFSRGPMKGGTGDSTAATIMKDTRSHINVWGDCELTDLRLGRLGANRRRFDSTLLNKNTKTQSTKKKTNPGCTKQEL